MPKPGKSGLVSLLLLNAKKVSSLGPKIRWIGRPRHQANPAPDQTQAAFSDADRLVNYAASHGASVEKGTLDGLVHARALMRQGRLSASAEAEFYQHFGELAKAVRPVTVASLKSFDDQPRKRWVLWEVQQSDADATLRYYEHWGLFWLVIVLLLQSYWGIGNFLMANLTILSDEKAQLNAGIEEEVQQAIVQKNVSTKQQNELKDDVLAQAMKAKMNYARESSFLDLIAVWISPWSKLARIIDRNLKPNYDEHFHSDTSWSNGAIARSVLNSLQTYALPPLYGLLGATAYVLRKLLAEIRSKTFRNDMRTSYELRIYLGLLAGLAIGWFVSPDAKSSQNVLQSLSPLALAFLAGYSVELLFAAMDRLINAFTGKAPGGPASDH
jgi:hypothetical protein